MPVILFATGNGMVSPAADYNARSTDVRVRRSVLATVLHKNTTSLARNAG
jgi:hypothetical protein